MQKISEEALSQSEHSVSKPGKCPGELATFRLENLFQVLLLFGFVPFHVDRQTAISPNPCSVWIFRPFKTMFLPSCGRICLLLVHMCPDRSTLKHCKMMSPSGVKNTMSTAELPCHSCILQMDWKSCRSFALCLSLRIS